MAMRVLVIGGAGYIGSHVVWAFLDRGFLVSVVDNLSTGARGLVAKNADFILGDIADEKLLDDIFRRQKIDAVIHLAASASVPESVAHPAKYYQNNTAASLTLMLACLRHRVSRFIFSSTAAVQSAISGDFLDETMPCASLNPYGDSKIMTEKMLADIGKSENFLWTALRYFNVCGADESLRAGDAKQNATTLVKTALECAVGKRPKLQIFGDDYDTEDGTAIRDYVHVGDIACAHVAALAMLDGGGKSDIFNIGTGGGFSVLQVIKAIKKVSGKNFATEVCPRRAGDPPRVVANTAKAKKIMKFEPRRTDLCEMMKTAWQWETKGLPALSPGHSRPSPGHSRLRGNDELMGMPNQ